MSVKQFDILYIDLDPTKGREKQKIQPCLVINNDMTIKGTNFVWILPITSREPKFPTDIEVKSKKRLVTGVIDTVQIRALNLNAHEYNYRDELQDSLKNDVLLAINTFLKPQ
ncbi:type II toxin-antitoxin system PemK/MazF family toxin [Staphylococcus simiae]|uniref:type II toxin-antitoxin system PemK/MazF family toxin n=1 Tax=Staphylococcus simiae TaxID=308354 RepID=UPI001A96AAE3|nr:type II toxin-antitoxin system PemK/MazF family toxin [Staphylococcus simiae]MBO1198137.1 type II toxin-antitoxin system PemK/MazF family toxin [Staphylococcus simiae]MBO1200319.1 type II toxin-antitoxin system PemK/MazF family toxin [Staphylococcus simiae]MBO1202517.1 type II toxin-antitoxin system PemK/MazF family toxin [Staphylococcus simiae]MBO1210205.1 type II toxin-antitoxin system PemK/MazF family toxin [Staphylococcus simiae]MBO1228661.1 type II toxin-antitoxin system PemK/MazF fami